MRTLREVHPEQENAEILRCAQDDRHRLLLASGLCLCALLATSSWAQVETIESPAPPVVWSGHGTAEGHLALGYSPAGAFSPDSSQLAIANGGDVALMELAAQGISHVLHPRVKGIANLAIESANFVSPDRLLIFARGEIARGSKGAGARTPLLAFRWDVKTNAIVGSVQGVNPKNEFGSPFWFPDIHYLGMNKDNSFELWNPETNASGRIVVPPLTRSAGLFALSPDGRWLLLARIEASSQTDPIVVRRSDNQFDNVLKGHTAAVSSLAFSRDSSKVATACDDGKVRIYSTLGWALLHTLEGHKGPVHWAEFSPNGQWVVSAGEDRTVRVWSADSGELLQTLSESPGPVLTVAFSPDSRFIAASTQERVLVWQMAAGLSQ